MENARREQPVCLLALRLVLENLQPSALRRVPLRAAAGLLYNARLATLTQRVTLAAPFIKMYRTDRRTVHVAWIHTAAARRCAAPPGGKAAAVREQRRSSCEGATTVVRRGRLGGGRGTGGRGRAVQQLRLAAPATMAHGVVAEAPPPGWTVHQDEASGAFYYYHVRSGQSQWELPGRQERIEALGTGRVEAFVVCFCVALVLGGLLAARLWYLRKFYPEKLNPITRRKERAGSRKSGTEERGQLLATCCLPFTTDSLAVWAGFDKFRATKPRGKFSQDGKGGRSANS